MTIGCELASDGDVEPTFGFPTTGLARAATDELLHATTAGWNRPDAMMESERTCCILDFLAGAGFHQSWNYIHLSWNRHCVLLDFCADNLQPHILFAGTGSHRSCNRHCFLLERLPSKVATLRNRSCNHCRQEQQSNSGCATTV